MSLSSFISLISFFVILYSKGLLSTLAVPKLLIEGLLLALSTVILLERRENLKWPAPGFAFVVLFTGWSLMACFYHGEGVLRGLLFTRYLVTGYVVFWAIWHSRFTAKQIYIVNCVIFVMFFLQIVAASYEVFIIREKTEAIVGTMFSGGGAIATVFPMFAFSFMLAFFLYYNKIIFLIGGLSFFIVGFASEKLGIYYLVPMVMPVGVLLFLKREGSKKAIKRIIVIAVLGFFALPFIVFLLETTGRTESIQNETGIKNKLQSFFDYSERYAFNQQSWHTSSRPATSIRVIEETFKRSPMVFLLGQGTEVFYDMSGQADEGAYDEYGIICGIVGWSYDALAIGWPAMFLEAGFFFYLFYFLTKRMLNQKMDKYWKSIYLAMQMCFFVFVLDYFLYSKSFVVGNWLSCVYLYFLALLTAPQYRKMLCDVSVN